MRRHLLGIIAIGLLLSGGMGLIWGYSTNSHAGMAAGVGFRVGLILTAFWMAYPQLAQVLQRVPVWLITLLATGGLIVAIRPQYFILVVIVLAILSAMKFVAWLFKPLPRPKRHPRKRPEQASQIK